ncbi:MAG TPA: polyprenyl synthetase family protein [Hellea balneolensis]|uniref:Polyprenyl synthetase family protein n=1 Tax=Hellea balneolensis TaxID=287478 RepID=A0A7C5M2H2_9PROT|nr:polyprenyl synthetase family protein [Hellea balneolensis]
MPSQSLDLNARLTKTAQRMESVLDGLLPKPEGAQAKIMQAVRYAVLGGGKRLRPFLMLETARLFGPIGNGLYRAASALECMHVYSLIHDDLPCMDDDDLRRGKPTVHKAYDEAMAVLAGDALLTLAFEILSHEETHGNADLRLKLITGLSKAGGMSGMIGGQVIDIYAPDYPQDEALIRQLQSLKTGALISYAVNAGALYGGANPEELAALSQYADLLGLAFQLRDDILDTEGSAQAMGKRTQKDAELGKATFVSIWGLEQAKSEAARLGQNAKQALDVFAERADTLRDTVDFVLSREK